MPHVRKNRLPLEERPYSAADGVPALPAALRTPDPVEATLGAESARTSGMTNAMKEFPALYLSLQFTIRTEE